MGFNGLVFGLQRLRMGRLVGLGWGEAGRQREITDKTDRKVKEGEEGWGERWRPGEASRGAVRFVLLIGC